MNQTVCKNCGADAFEIKDGYKVCRYCNSRYEPEKSEMPQKTSEVSLKSDIEILLEKCQKDPRNAKKYAGLILDIDPTNREAKKYL